MDFFYFQVQFLAQECQELVTKPNFVSLLCYSIDNPESSQKVWFYCCYDKMLIKVTTVKVQIQGFP